MAIVNYAKDPEEVSMFPQVNGNTDVGEMDIPIKFYKRRRTDGICFIFMIAILLAVIPFLVYSLIYSDINRFYYRTDNCGDICGVKNTPNGIPCSGKNTIDLPVLVYYYMNETYSCEANCPPAGSSAICTQYDGLRELKMQVLESLKLLLFPVLVIGLNVGYAAVFKYITEVMVWVILIGFVIVGCIVLALFTFIGQIIAEFVELFRGSYSENNLQKLHFLMPILLTISFLYLIVFICFKQRMRVIIQLFKETTKAIFAIQWIFCIPVLGSLLSMVIVVVIGFSFVILSTSGVITSDPLGRYDYKPTAVMYATKIFWSFALVWLAQFILNTLYMITSLVISEWLFKSSKRNTQPSIKQPIAIVFHFHSGTLAIGSFILTIATCLCAVLPPIFAFNQVLFYFCSFGIFIINELAHTFVKCVYVETALHGAPYFGSVKKLFRSMEENWKNFVAFKTLGNIVLKAASVWVFLLGGFLGHFSCSYLLQQDYDLPVVICYVVSFIAALNFFTTLEAAADTAFICLCEDVSLNDGIERPYNMPQELITINNNSNTLRS